jgi:quinol monooxygenase YgiN
VIRHVVMWTLKDPGDTPRFKDLLDGCAAPVPGTLQFEVGIRDAALDPSLDVVLVSTFADDAALDAYQNHPRHMVVSAQLGALRSARQVLDHRLPAPPAARR